MYQKKSLATVACFRARQPPQTKETDTRQETKDEIMFDIHRVEIEWGGRKLKLETGHMARQADAAVLAQYGETSVLATVVYNKSPKPGVDFFPLTVNYQEKTFAAGKIPGGYFKREGRPSEKETLISRLIDRPIRPLFVEGFKHEVQVVVTVLSFDNENDSDVVALVAASAALTLSGAPFLGPIGAAKVGYIDGQLVLNPLIDEMAKTKLDLVVAGTHDAVMMVESEAHELSEQLMLEAVMFGHRHFQPVIQAIIKLAETAAKEPFDFKPPQKDKFYAQGKALIEDDLRAAFSTPEKQKRNDMVDQAKAKLMAAHPDPGRRHRSCRQADPRRHVQAARDGRDARHGREDRTAHRRSRPQDRAPDRLGGACAAAYARLGAVHARRDAGAGGCHAGHRRRRAVHRQPGRHPQGALPAALQLPAILGR